MFSAPEFFLSVCLSFLRLSLFSKHTGCGYDWKKCWPGEPCKSNPGSHPARSLQAPLLPQKAFLKRHCFFCNEIFLSSWKMREEALWSCKFYFLLFTQKIKGWGRDLICKEGCYWVCPLLKVNISVFRVLLPLFVFLGYGSTWSFWKLLFITPWFL